MSAGSYEELRAHIGHEIECVQYARRDALGLPTEPPHNVAVECVTCNEILLDFDAPAPDEAIEVAASVRQTWYPDRGIVRANCSTCLWFKEYGPGTRFDLIAAEVEAHLKAGHPDEDPRRWYRGSAAGPPIDRMARDPLGVPGEDMDHG